MMVGTFFGMNRSTGMTCHSPGFAFASVTLPLRRRSSCSHHLPGVGSSARSASGARLAAEMMISCAKDAGVIRIIVATPKTNLIKCALCCEVLFHVLIAHGHSEGPVAALV